MRRTLWNRNGINVTIDLEKRKLEVLANKNWKIIQKELKYDAKTRKTTRRK